MVKKFEIKSGKEKYVFEIGKIAKQANGSVMGKYGGTVVIANAVMGKNELDTDFFPLTVHYFEKAYAAGKIPGGFIKREGRPSDREILISRLIDRPIRPLFPENFRREVQVVTFTVSSDQINPPDVLAINSSSLALVISDIPFIKPIAAVRIGYNNNFIINPNLTELIDSKLDIVVAGTEDAIIMVEGGAKEVTEEILLDACKFAHEEIKRIIELFKDIRNELGKPKLEVQEPEFYEEFFKILEVEAKNELTNSIFVKEKLERNKAIEKTKELMKDKLKTKVSNIIPFSNSDLTEEERETLFDKLYNEYFDKLTKKIMRKYILEEGKRADGRGLKDVRPINIELGILPYTHGSALFTRGETQSLAITTLGTILDQQKLDDIEGEEFKRFMLHYNFPAFSVGETGRYGAPGRREIGHGHLAERSLEYVIPEFDEFPYTIRIVSEILESNGSSSMASVCGGSLSMYDAGVPIKKLVAGIAMGLVKEDDRYAILTDIMGMEDHLGDMDFKVAGTRDGITGFQMDVKIEGISFDIFKEALLQAKEGRNYILELMEKECEKNEHKLSEFAPKIKVLHIDPDKLGLLIGAGGKVIKSIINETNSLININPDGQVMISNKDENMIKKTVELIEMYTNTEAKLNDLYNATIKKILPYGLLVEFIPGHIGLVHKSELSDKPIFNLNEYFRIGEKIKVRLIKIDADENKYFLSHKEFFKDNSEKIQ